MLIAIGIDWDGRGPSAHGLDPWGQVLAVELANRESRSSWRDFLLGLKARGLHGVEFVVADDHAGLRAALREALAEVMPSTPGAPLLRTTARNAASILSGSQSASMRCSVDAGLSGSVVAVAASTSCTSRRGASPRPGIGKANSSWYGGRIVIMRRPIYSPFPSTPSGGPFGPSASTPAYDALC